MPTPIDILLDPVSLILLAIYCSLIVIEAIAPAQKLKKVDGWIPKALAVFVLYFFLSSYLPLVWDKYLVSFRVINLAGTSPVVATVITVGLFELLVYVWHRAIHRTPLLWRMFHQLHHSAERLDTYGAFYFSPLDMVGFTLLSSISLALFFDLPAQSIVWFLYITMLLPIVQHANIRTPQWLGYIVQRPESHSIHHQKGVHAYNYSDLPIFDILFGTFKNPKAFTRDIGFYDGASHKVLDMLLCKDINKNVVAKKVSKKA